MRNIPLLEATMEHITRFPELHRQDWYFQEVPCGTACCFAGRACILGGLKLKAPNATMSSQVYMNGKLVYADWAAEKLLGLSHREAAHLFCGQNTRAMLRLMVDDLVNGRKLRDFNSYKQETYREYVS